ncbi:MAG: acyltransferase family protein [Propionibacteriaceae bacterium]|nr:acyltransferase family protein [Propionibacteriaceae bacterium]
MRPPGGRWLALDLARGVAVVSMVVAHTAPVGGIFNVSEYLTAPLFALAIGASMTLAFEKTRLSFGRFWAAEVARGAVLVGLGVLLEAAYPQILGVLISLGLLMALLPPLLLLRHRIGLLLVVVGVLALALPPLRLAGEAWLAYQGPPASPGQTITHWIVYITVAHPAYRLPAFGVAAGLGILAARLLEERPPTNRTALLGAAGAATLSGTAIVVGKITGWGGDPYAGTYPELVASTAIAVAALLGCVAWARHHEATRLRSVTWLVESTGRLALTAYALHVLALAALSRFVLGGGRDDHWWVLVTVTAIVVAFAALWRRWVGPIGPAEWLVRWPMRLLGHPTEAGTRRR